METLNPVKNTQKETVKPPKMWKIVVLNDDFTPFEFVMYCLSNIFSKSHEESEKITMNIHNEGKGLVGVYTKDIAQTKVEVLMQYAQHEGFPLKAITEEV